MPVRRRGARLEQDFVVVEAPLEIRVGGRPLVVTMRTPGHDAELAAGFLYAEGLIAGAADVASLRTVAGSAPPGGDADDGLRVTRHAGDRVDAVLARQPAAAAGDAPPRAFRATAACGVCGKESIEQLEQLGQALPPLAAATGGTDPDADLLEALPARLRAAQQIFDATGGIHAAGIFTLAGDLLCAREDIGRHNAVDKVIGRFVLGGGVPLRDRILVVSGRAGFELVQKALKAAVPVMVSVGAASSVAVDMATAAGMMLYSFAGRGRGNLHVPA